MLCFVMNLGSSLGLEHTFIFLSFHANGIFKGFFTIQTLCHFGNQNVQHMDPIVNFRLELKKVYNLPFQNSVKTTICVEKHRSY